MSAGEILLISIERLGIVILVVAFLIAFWLWIFPVIIDFKEKEILADGKRRPIPL